MMIMNMKKIIRFRTIGLTALVYLLSLSFTSKTVRGEETTSWGISSSTTSSITKTARQEGSAALFPFVGIQDEVGVNNNNNSPISKSISSTKSWRRQLEYECCQSTSSAELVGEVVCPTQMVAECCQVCEERQAEDVPEKEAATADGEHHTAADDEHHTDDAAGHSSTDNSTSHGDSHATADGHGATADGHGATADGHATATNGHATTDGHASSSGGHSTTTSAGAHGSSSGGHGSEAGGHGGNSTSHGSGGHHAHPPGHACLFPSIILTLGLVVYFLLSRYAHWLPYTAVMFLIGTGIGVGITKLGNQQDHFAVTSSMWANIDAEVLLLTFLPGLIFKDAFGMNVHLFRVGFFQCLNFAFPMVLIGMFASAAVAFYIFPYGWSFNLCMIFGAILSATDPVAVAALLEEVGAPPRLKVHIGGEALLNDGAAIVFFWVFAFRYFYEVDPNYALSQNVGWADGFLLFFKMSLGGAAIGFAFGIGFLLMLYQLGRRFSREENIVEVMATLAIAYLGYYVAEVVAKTSGVIATVACACTVKSFGKAMINDAKLLDDFWTLLEHILNTLLFALGGVVWGDVLATDVFKAKDWGYLFMLYGLLTCIRGFNFFLFYPITSRIGLKTNLKETIFQIYGGLRGAVGIALAIALDNEIRKETGDGSTEAKQTAKLFGFIGGMAFLTLVINGITAGPFLIKLGLADSTESRKTLVETCKNGFQKHMNSEFVRLLSQHRFRNVNYGLVRAHVSTLKALNTQELLEAIDDVKDTTATQDYRPPELGGVIPYMNNGKGDHLLEQAVKNIQEEMASREGQGQDLLLSSHGSGLTRGRSGLHRRRSTHISAESMEPLSAQEMRLLFISLLRAEYEAQLDNGELADETLQAIALEESLEFANEECTHGGKIDDWKFVKMFDGKAHTAIKIWKNSFTMCLGKSKRGVKTTFKKQRIERAMNFMAAHEAARDFIQQEFIQVGNAEVQHAAKIVIKESKAQWDQADALLHEYERAELEFVISLKFCAILLTSGIQYISRLVDRGFLKDDEAEHWVHHIEEELEHVQNVSTEDISSYPGYIQVDYIDPTMRGNELELAIITEETSNNLEQSIQQIQGMKDLFDDEDVLTEDNSSGSMNQGAQNGNNPQNAYKELSQSMSSNPQNSYKPTSRNKQPGLQNGYKNMAPSLGSAPSMYEETPHNAYNSTSQSRPPNPPNPYNNMSSSMYPNPQAAYKETSRNRQPTPPNPSNNTSSNRHPNSQNAYRDRSTSELRRLCRENGIDPYGMSDKKQMVDALVRSGALGEPQDVGFYNTIDGTDMRSDVQSDAGVLGEKYRGKKYPKVVPKEKYSSTKQRGTGGRYSPDSPVVWEEWYAPGQRRHYYVDPATGTTTWTKPTNPRAQIIQQQASTIPTHEQSRQQGVSASIPPIPAGWEQHFDPTQNRNYYVNSLSGITQWERPR